MPVFSFSPNKINEYYFFNMRNYLKTLLTVSFVILYTNILNAKDGYKIKIKIRGIKDTVCYLAYYYGDKQYVQDTAKVDKDGKFIFKGNNDLKPAMYIVAGEKNNMYFDFFVNKKQHFSMETDIPNITKNMKVRGSPENKLFYEYINFIIKKKKEIKPLKKNLTNFRQNKDSIKLIQEKINIINKEVKNYNKEFIRKHSRTFAAKFLKASFEPEIPKVPLLKNGTEDSAYIYKYYKKHFFDNIDFTDVRLLRTPIFNDKINQYFKRLVVQQPDSIIKEVDMLIEKTKSDKEIHKYLLWYFTVKYLNSNIMGLDAVFVHIAEKYYQKEDSNWINPVLRRNIIKRANILKLLLIGKKAPDILMFDTNNQLVSLYNIKARYTIIVFWDTECGFCLKEIPKLKKFYDKDKEKYGLEVFAVNVDTSIIAMKNYIKKNNLNWVNVNGYRSLTPDFHILYDIFSTPTIYLLDEKKVIIAKGILTDKLKVFIKKYDNKKNK